MSALSDLINHTLKRRGWFDKSLRELAAATDDAVSKDAWAGYRNGKHGIPHEGTLEAIAGLLGLSMAELRRASGVPVGSDGPYAGPPESARMSQRQRLALDELIRSIVTSERTQDEEAQEPQQDQGSKTSSRARRQGGSRGAPIAAVPDWESHGKAARKVDPAKRDPAGTAD